MSGTIVLFCPEIGTNNKTNHFLSLQIRSYKTFCWLSRSAKCRALWYKYQRAAIS